MPCGRRLALWAASTTPGRAFVKVGEGMPRAVPARSFSLRWGVGAVLAAGLISGCSGSAEPAPSGSPGGASPSVVHSGSPSASPSGSVSGSPSVSPSPSSSAPSAPVSIPAAARANTQEGAVEFAKFFLTAGSRAETNWDNSVVRSLSDARCTTCEQQMASIDERRAKGERTKDTRFQPVSTQVGPGPVVGSYSVDVLAKFKATDVLDSSGRVLRSLPEETQGFRVYVQRGTQGWTVTQVAELRT
jgi:hypothetical protein